jgi:hypothetical protein
MTETLCKPTSFHDLLSWGACLDAYLVRAADDVPSIDSPDSTSQCLSLLPAHNCIQ